MRTGLHWWTCMLGGGAIVFALLFCTSCTVAGGEGWFYASAGADADGLKAGPNGLKADKLRQGETARELGDAMKTASVVGSVAPVIAPVVRETFNGAEALAQ